MSEHLKHVTPDEHDAPDAWHRHAPGERPQRAHGEIANAGLIMGVGMLMFLGLVFTVVIVYGYYTWYTTALLEKQEVASLRNGVERGAIEYKLSTLDNFRNYRWVAEEPPVVPKDTVQVPLDVAVRKVITRYAANKD